MAAGKFLAFRELSWTDAHGVGRVWEAAERPGGFRAVVIIPRLSPSGGLVLIRQFRPPARGWVVEFPAGILDPGEDPAAGAARELREETGYRAERIVVHPPAFTSPGLSDETVFIAAADIDETAPANRDRRTEFDPGEMIETIVVARGELAALYARESAAGVLFDCKVAAYALATAGL